jgi:hypothetical protein
MVCGSPQRGSVTWADGERWAMSALRRDAWGQRAELLGTVRTAASLAKGRRTR